MKSKVEFVKKWTRYKDIFVVDHKIIIPPQRIWEIDTDLVPRDVRKKYIDGLIKKWTRGIYMNSRRCKKCKTELEFHQIQGIHE